MSEAAGGKPLAVGADAAAWKFSGAMLLNEERLTPRRSILICGVTRGGTSFAASALHRLGVPFTRQGDPGIGRRLEHRDLRFAFEARDAASVKRIAGEFAAEHPVWAWKLPDIQTDFAFVSDCVPDPHYVLIYKEPLSVAARKQSLKGYNPLGSLRATLADYDRMAAFAITATAPVLLVSYDAALKQLEDFLPQVARFAGVQSYKQDKVIAGIQRDADRYFAPKQQPSAETQ